MIVVVKDNIHSQNMSGKSYFDQYLSVTELAAIWSRPTKASNEKTLVVGFLWSRLSKKVERGRSTFVATNFYLLYYLDN